MIEIKMMRLIYSHAKNDLCTVEVKPKNCLPAGYVVLTEQMDQKDAAAFIRSVGRKYVKGRKSGRYPAVDIVKLELELFVRLKACHRKLV